jgi:hypothetical protein
MEERYLAGVAKQASGIGVKVTHAPSLHPDCLSCLRFD